MVAGISAAHASPATWPPLMYRARHSKFKARRSSELRLGYVPLTHAAPILAALELGIFARHGLRVRLSREVGWATVREKILSGELDAAQALAPMPLAMTLGLNSARVDCLTALIMTMHGNAIVLSRRLWSSDSNSLSTLREERQRRADPLTFAAVYPHSTQLFVLRDAFRKVNLLPERDFRLVILPPPQMVTHLRTGHIDGFCVGEPWASLAVCTRTGVIAAFSADLAPGHPEKILLVRRTFSVERAEEHAALIRALMEACQWCADPRNHDAVIELLARPGVLGVAPGALRPAITGEFDLGGGRSIHHPEAMVFHGPQLNEPTLDRFQWIAHHVDPTVSVEVLHRVYRPDLFRAALTSPSPSPTPSPASHDEIHSCAN